MKAALFNSIRRGLATSANKVAVLGCAGGIGQPLSLLLKQCPIVTNLSLYDIAPVTKGIGVDLSHCDTHAKVSAWMGEIELPKALDGCDVVLIPAGIPRKPGMTRDDLFKVNASIVGKLSRAIGLYCPHALVLVISNPVNSMVPLMATILKRMGVYNPKKLFGVSTLDVIRANTFAAEAHQLDVCDMDIRVIGGHAGVTIIPVFSLEKSLSSMTDQVRDSLTHRVMFGGDEVVKAKAGQGSATLSMAYAAHKFACQILRARGGQTGIVECSFVDTPICSGVSFFASPVRLGRNGIEEVIDLIPRLSPFERKKLDEAFPELKASIQKGISFGESFKLEP